MMPDDKCPFCGRPYPAHDGTKGNTRAAACSKCGVVACKRCIQRGRCPTHRRPVDTSGLARLANSSGDVRGKSKNG